MKTFILSIILCALSFEAFAEKIISPVDVINNEDDPFEKYCLKDPLEKYRIINKKMENDVVIKILNKLNEFAEEEKCSFNFKLWKNKVKLLCSSLDELSLDFNEIPEEVKDEFCKILLEQGRKYQDDLLKEDGISLGGNYPGGYTIFFETVKKYKVFEFPWFDDYRHLRFRISEVDSKPSIDDLTNVILILQTIDGFELARKDIGVIKKHGWTSGEIYMKESNYKKLAKSALLTDQDR